MKAPKKIWERVYQLMEGTQALGARREIVKYLDACQIGTSYWMITRKTYSPPEVG
jgi:hypothetical protein